MENDIKHYLDNNNHLPEFIKDFHDQKDIFKTIHSQLGNDSNIKEDVNWVNAHCYTIDFFLWWCAMHGYKLQKTRSKNIEFMNIENSIKNFK